MSLTDAGTLFYEHCARIVQEAALAEERLTRAQSEPAGLVRVTAVPAFATRYVLLRSASFISASRGSHQCRRTTRSDQVMEASVRLFHSHT